MLAIDALRAHGDQGAANFDCAEQLHENFSRDRAGRHA